ncbi:MAG: MoxR family ATPase [Planctomycetes bacterium]|nr:MoxR family ATPase [Planctomycetota bacterium]
MPRARSRCLKECDPISSHDPAGFRTTFDAVRSAIATAVVGQEAVVESVLVCLFADGHCLLEGVPGVGKTLLVRSVAAATGVQFARIQFTPDLMPADVIGTDFLSVDENGRTAFEFRPGPIFGSIVLADEINRATPKTQSALLQAMEEREVTVARTTRALPRPFLVLATQNPLEMEGTYPLPEAQLDRFLMKIDVSMPPLSDLLRIVDRTTGGDRTTVPQATDAETVIALQRLARQAVIAPHLREFLGRLVLATHPTDPAAPAIVRKSVRCGASPRAAQALALSAKVRALARGRAHVAEEDLRALAPAVLQHRLLLSYEGEADGVTSEQVVREVLSSLKA